MNPQKRRAIFGRLRAANPHPRTELEYRTPFELLVAVVLSAQATDKSVNKATTELFKVANTPTAVAKLGVDGLIPYIQAIGLFRTKAKNVAALVSKKLKCNSSATFSFAVPIATAAAIARTSSK